MSGNALNEFLGNSQLRGVSKTETQDSSDQQTKINFLFISGGTSKDIIRLWEKRIALATVPTKCALSLFQNGIKTFGVDGSSDFEMKNLVRVTFNIIEGGIKVIKQLNGLEHKVNVCEELFPPELHQYFEKIDWLNKKIRGFNVKNGVYPFKVWKLFSKKAPKNPLGFKQLLEGVSAVILK